MTTCLSSRPVLQNGDPDDPLESLEPLLFPSQFERSARSGKSRATVTTPPLMDAVRGARGVVGAAGLRTSQRQDAVVRGVVASPEEGDVGELRQDILLEPGKLAMKKPAVFAQEKVG